jgi:hypothetical protein
VLDAGHRPYPPQPISDEMKISFLVIMPLLFGFVMTGSGQVSNSDSSKTTQAPKPYTLRLTTRLLSQGAFYYSGRIISKNPALDFFFLYERKRWGFSVFKAFDLYDHLSDNNFSLALLYKNFHLSKKLTITPHVGFDFEQNHGIADPGSDVSVIIITAFKINQHFTVDNSSFFSNLVLESNTKDWVNRYRLLYTSPHLDITLYAWHNNRVFDNNDYFSTGFNITYARIRVSKNILVNAGVSLLAMLHTSDEVLYPKRNGLIFTLGVVID